MGWPKFPAIACAATLSLWPVAIAYAGDGSYADNPDILRDGYKVDWVPANAPLPGEGPAEDMGLPFRTDWSLSLRGAYQHDNGGDHYEALIVPQASLTRVFERGQLSANTEAELGKLDGDAVRINALRLAIAGDYRLDSLTQASGNLSFSRAQDSVLNAAADVAQTPVVTGAEADGTVTRQFGKLSVALRGSFGRTVYEPTTLIDGTLRDNGYRSSTYFGGGLRAGWELTPIFTFFGDASVQRNLYDAISPSVGVKTDNYDTALRVGVSGKWQDRLEAEVSGGLGFVNYDDAGLRQVSTTLYDASVTYRPDPTIAIRGALGTAFVPPSDNIASTRVEYRATLDASYQINAWLALRANAAWSQVRYEDGSSPDTSYGVGVGADYTLNRHTVLTADYGFAHTEDAPNAARDAHRVTLGVTFKK